MEHACRISDSRPGSNVEDGSSLHQPLPRQRPSQLAVGHEPDAVGQPRGCAALAPRPHPFGPVLSGWTGRTPFWGFCVVRQNLNAKAGATATIRLPRNPCTEFTVVRAVEGEALTQGRVPFHACPQTKSDYRKLSQVIGGFSTLATSSWHGGAPGFEINFRP